jgi:hypothetical protein
MLVAKVSTRGSYYESAFELEFFPIAVDCRFGSHGTLFVPWLLLSLAKPVYGN